jgi:chaperonin GroES
MTLRPLYDRIVLRRKEPETQTKGGLVLPTNAQEQSNLGEVVAVGTGRLLDSGETAPLKVETGMTVLIGKWAGDAVKIDGDDLLIVREADILAVVD